MRCNSGSYTISDWLQVTPSGGSRNAAMFLKYISTKSFYCCHQRYFFFFTVVF